VEYNPPRARRTHASIILIRSAGLSHERTDQSEASSRCPPSVSTDSLWSASHSAVKQRRRALAPPGEGLAWRRRASGSRGLLVRAPLLMRAVCQRVVVVHGRPGRCEEGRPRLMYRCRPSARHRPERLCVCVRAKEERSAPSKNNRLPLPTHVVCACSQNKCMFINIPSWLHPLNELAARTNM
jgi:hypothetical protein